MTTSTTTIGKALKAGAMAGAIGAGANSLWSFIAASLGATIPPGFFMGIILSSIFPVIIGSLIFFGLLKLTGKGQLIWYIIGIGFTLFSFYPVFNTPQLPDGTLLDSTFPLLAGPMHLISGFLATWGIPKWSK